MADRSVNVKLRMNVAEYLAGARAASAATRDVDKSARELRKALDEEEAAAGRVRVAEQRLNEIRADGKAKASQLAAAEEELARAHRQHETATDRVTQANERFVESQKKAAAESKKSTDKVDGDMSRLAARTNAQFDALKFTGLSVGLPAAAAVGVAATTGIVAAAGAAFIGLGVMGAYGAEQVSNAWTATANVVTHGITDLSESYQGPLVRSAEMVSDAFVHSSGLIRTGLLNASGGVESLTRSGLNLAQNALPGLVTASGRLEPVLDGVDALLSDVGLGFGEMAANASTGSEGARKGLVILADTLRTTEARVGTIAANFANASSGPLNSFRYTLDQVTGALVDASAQGSAVNGFLGGFTTSTNGAITVARGLFTVINALPPQVAQLGGAVASTSMIMSKLGVDAGAGWDGLGGKIRAAGKDLAGTEKFAAKAGTAVGGLAAGALNPAALAVGALSLGLLILGDSQEKAAAAAAEHRDGVRQLTDAIRADNGVIAEHSATTIANALASKGAADNTRAVGISMGTATTAAMGNQKAMFAVEDATNRTIQALKGHGIEGQRDLDGLKKLNKGLLENGGSFASLGTEVHKYTEGLFNGANPAAAEALTRALDLSGAVGEQARQTREAYQGYLLQEEGLTGLTEAQIKARDATQEHTKAIYDQQNAELGYRGSVQSSKEAVDAYNKIVKDGKANTDEGARALLAMEQAFSQQEQAAYNAAYASSTATTENGKLAFATAALNRETVNIANSFTGQLPQSMQQTIGKMNATEAQAAGLKLTVNKLGQAVYQLPNGKQILIASNADQEAAKMQNLRDKINQIPTSKKSTVEIVTIYRQVGTAAVRTGANSPDVYLYGPHAAAGGLVSKAPLRKFADGGIVDVRPGGLLRGPGTRTSDSIVGMSSRGPAAFSDEEFVVNAEDTKRALPILQFINKGGLRGYAGGGLMQAEDGSWVPDSFYGKAPSGPHAMLTDQGYAKLRAMAAVNGIGSLPAILRNQLRTYGGWAETPVQRGLAAGTMVQSAGRGYGSGAVQINISFPNYVGNQNELISAIRSKVSDLGGDVQNALGRRG